MEDVLYQVGCWGSGVSSFGAMEGFNRTISFDQIGIKGDLVIDDMYVGVNQVFIRAANNILAVGNNYYGQLGLGHYRSIKKFEKLEGTTKNIFLGNNRSFRLNDRGDLYASGFNYSGQLALRINIWMTDEFMQVKTKGIGKVETVLCGESHTFFLSDKGLYVCGENSWGALGLGKIQNTGYQMIKVDTKERGRTVEISAGKNHTILRTDKGLYGCGANHDGELGIQDKNVSTFLKLPLEIGEIESMKCGENWSIFATKFSVFGCGNNSEGQLGFPRSVSNVTTPTEIKFDERITEMLRVKRLYYSLASSAQTLFSHHQPIQNSPKSTMRARL